MSGPIHQTEAHLLALAPHTGDHLVLTCFSPADGLFSALLRPPRGLKTDAAPPPDLFDRLALELRHAKGAPAGVPWFVREYRILARRAGLGRDNPTRPAPAGPGEPPDDLLRHDRPLARVVRPPPVGQARDGMEGGGHDALN